MSELFTILYEIKNIMLSFINIQTITFLITTILSCCLLLYVGWFAIRFIVKSVLNALNGNLILDSNSRKARKWYKKEGYKYYKTYNDYVETFNKNSMANGDDYGFIK